MEPKTHSTIQNLVCLCREFVRHYKGRSASRALSLTCLSSLITPSLLLPFVSTAQGIFDLFLFGGDQTLAVGLGAATAAGTAVPSCPVLTTLNVSEESLSHSGLVRSQSFLADTDLSDPSNLFKVSLASFERGGRLDVMGV